MAFVLELTDGTTTIDFMEEAFLVEDGGLQIAPPDKVQTWTEASVSGGAGLVDSRYGNRTISITFQIGGATRQDIRDGINTVNEMLRTAIQHSLGQTATRVTLKYAWDGVSTVDNFEVLSGTLTLPDDTLSVEKIHAKWGESYRLIGCKLELVSSPYAYGLSPSTGSLIELPLYNRNGEGITGGISVGAFQDSRNINPYGFYYDNYVEVAGEDIEGDAPAKLRIEYQAMTTSAKLRRLAIGCHTATLQQMAWHWADPAVSILLGGGSITAADYAMGGSAWRSGILNIGWSGSIFRVNLPNPHLYHSERYRVFMSAGFFPYRYMPNITYQARVLATNLAVLDEGPMVQQQHGAGSALPMIQDLGVVQIPPFSQSVPNPQNVYLDVRVADSRSSLNGFAMTLNHVWLIPVDHGYRYFSFLNEVGSYAPNNATIIDDDWQGISYVKDATTTRTAVAGQAMYAPIYLKPGVTQRIYFTSWGRPPQQADHYKVRVYYSPVYTGAV